MKANHIGIVVQSIDESIKYYTENLEYNVVSKLFIDDIQRVKIQFLQSNDEGICIELIEPIASDSPVANFLRKGGGLNHICYEVSDINDAIDALKKKRHRLISGPVPACAFNGKKVAFLFSKYSDVIELVEK